ncbi:MAG: DUF4339 domain-containing protein [Treponema sp.]|nr:DUF4339 domain-containing protein [Treponema sp.]
MGSNTGFSMDRLLEFGMNAAVAGQVMRNMNQTMSETMQPWPASMKGPGTTMPPSHLYYVALDGKQAGPFSETEIIRLVNEKRITKDTLVWHQGMPAWKRAEDLPEMLRIIALAPPPLNVIA